jgi:hypothetical protein
VVEIHHHLDDLRAARVVVGPPRRERLRHRIVALAGADRSRVRVVERIAEQVRVVAVV